MSELSDAFYTQGGPLSHRDIPFIVVAEARDDSRDIRVYDLCIRTPGENGRVLLKDVNLHFRPGDRVIFTGESGSGKTTAVKALMDQWDYGQGLVVMPRGMRTMLFSQAAYAPNANLRTVLNMATEGKGKFSDHDLRLALQNVGLDKLIQQIPGQQVEMLIDALMEDIPVILSGVPEYELSAVKEKISDRIKERVPQMFNSVQYVPDEQRAYLHVRLDEVFQKCGINLRQDDTENIANSMAHDIDMSLLHPLEKRLKIFAADLAERKQGRIFSYTPLKIDYFNWAFGRFLKKAMNSFLANEDTDDSFREIRMNKAQADRVVAFMSETLKTEMLKHSSADKLHQAFNAASWPLSLQMLRMKAKSAVNEIVQAVTFFMDKQVTTGDTLSLSGGERQKLMIAIAGLHRPDILFLDEITAALDRDTGETLYKELLDSLPKDTIVISIAHNLHILKYHTIHAHLENQNVSVTRIALQDATPSAPGPAV